MHLLLNSEKIVRLLLLLLLEFLLGGNNCFKIHVNAVIVEVEYCVNIFHEQPKIM